MKTTLSHTDWMQTACRFWSIANELIHHVDAGRLIEAPRSSFDDRRQARAVLAAVRRILEESPFNGAPDDFEPDATAGAGGRP